MSDQEQREALESIRNRIRADLKPVRPLQSERLCLGAASAFILVSFAVLAAFFGLRPDRNELGELWLWGPSVLQILLAMIALGLAMKESLPGRSSSPRALWAAAGAGLACHVATTLRVSEMSLIQIPEGSSLQVGLLGFGVEVCVGIPMVAVAIWIAQRGFTARTGRLGLMIGLGAAIAADAVWRLFCPFSDVRYVFGSHTLAIIVVVCVGWLLADWWRRRMLNGRSAPA